MSEQLAQAKEIVNNWVNVGRGQAGFEWQHQSLLTLGSRPEARELTEWWSTHPANTSK